MKRVAYLIPDTRPLTSEEIEAWLFLRNTKGIQARRITFAQAGASPSSLARYDVVWWHCAEEYPGTGHITPQVMESIRRHVARGRGLLLSLLSCQYVVELGLEIFRPSVLLHSQWAEASWADNYPDIRGFGGYNHPIFANFSGGLYTWSPRIGDPYSACFYEDTLPTSGKVVAVEKLYIKLNEQRRTIVEYSVGRGRILVIGCHFYFGDRTQRFRAHLEKFARNCLDYLGEMHGNRTARASSERMHWNFDEPIVSAFEHASKALGRISTSLPSISSALEIHRETSTDPEANQFFGLTGRRLFVMGNERCDISEVWSNPVRIFKNIKIGFKVGDHDWCWSCDLTPTITIRPESVTRRYCVEGVSIEEVICASLLSPAGFLHYKIDADQTVQIVVLSQTDLRLMWPLSEHATGSLRCSWDPGLRSALITDSSGKNTAIIGSSSPPLQQLVGQFSEITIIDDRFVGTPTDRIQVTSAMRVSLTAKTRQCAFVLAGSGLSMEEAVRSYRRAMADLPEILLEQVRRFNRLLGSSLQIKTPDEEFNKSYRWSVARTDMFFAETPGLGSSFLAGYGLSSAGWDGGQKVSGRPGYAWYFGRDSAWTSMAALAYGDFDKVRAVLEFLGRHQDISGKILHELTASGHAHYDAADSTPLYIVLFGRYLRATGDISFARKQMGRIRKALQYCFSTDTDRDHLIENSNSGHGWIEGGRLFPAHAEHYLASCWAQALAEAAYIAKTVKEYRLARHYEREASRVRRILKEDFRNDDTGFYNFAVNRDGSFRCERTILPTVGMYFDCADESFAHRSLSEYASDRFSSDWGVRIVGKDDPLFDPTGYHYGSIWPLFTGWTSLAEFRMNRPLQGFNHLLTNALLFDQFSAGAIAEVLHGTRFQPAGVCPQQAWSGTMIIQPAVEGMLGVKTNAQSHSIELRPYFPPQWRTIEVRNIRLGSERVRMKVHREASETVFSFSVTSSPRGKRSHAIALRLRPVFPLGTHLHGVRINGKRTGLRRIINEYESGPVIRATIRSSLEIRIEHSDGVSVVPPQPQFMRGGASRGLRIVEERLQAGRYLLTLEGKGGEDYLLDVCDPSEKMKRIDGAVALVRERDCLTLSVVFPKDSSTDYIRKEIKLSM